MKANTDEMKRIAGEISSLATQYQDMITKLFNRFSNMPYTREWVGGRAREYVSYVMLDKQDLISVGKKIKDFSRVIIEDANILESNVSKAERNEASE